MSSNETSKLIEISVIDNDIDISMNDKESNDNSSAFKSNIIKEDKEDEEKQIFDILKSKASPRSNKVEDNIIERFSNQKILSRNQSETAKEINQHISNFFTDEQIKSLKFLSFNNKEKDNGDELPNYKTNSRVSFRPKTNTLLSEEITPIEIGSIPYNIKNNINNVEVDLIDTDRSIMRKIGKSNTMSSSYYKANNLNYPIFPDLTHNFLINLENVNMIEEENEKSNSDITSIIMPSFIINKLIIIYSYRNSPLEIMKVISEEDDLIRLKPLKNYLTNNEFITTKEDIFYQSLSENSLLGEINLINLNEINELSILKNIESLKRSKINFLFIGSDIFASLDSNTRIFEFNEWSATILKQNMKCNEYILSNSINITSNNYNSISYNFNCKKKLLKNSILPNQQVPLIIIRNLDSSLSKAFSNRNDFQYHALKNILYYNYYSFYKNKKQFITKVTQLINFLNIESFFCLKIDGKCNIQLCLLPLFSQMNINLYKKISILYVDKKSIKNNEILKIIQIFKPKDYYSYLSVHEYNFLSSYLEEAINENFNFLIIVLYLLKETKKLELFRDIINLILYFYIMKHFRRIAEANKVTELGKFSIKYTWLYTFMSNIIILFIYNVLLKSICKNIDDETANLQLVLNNSKDDILSEIIFDTINQGKSSFDNNRSCLGHFMSYSIENIVNIFKDKEFSKDIDIIVYIEGLFTKTIIPKLLLKKSSNQLLILYNLYDDYENIIQNNYKKRQIKQIINLKMSNLSEYFSFNLKESKIISEESLIPLKVVTENRLISYINLSKIKDRYIIIPIDILKNKYISLFHNINDKLVNDTEIIANIIENIQKDEKVKYNYVIEGNYIHINFNIFLLLTNITKENYDVKISKIQSRFKVYYTCKYLLKLRISTIFIQRMIRQRQQNRLNLYDRKQCITYLKKYNNDSFVTFFYNKMFMLCHCSLLKNEELFNKKLIVEKENNKLRSIIQEQTQAIENINYNLEKANTININKNTDKNINYSNTTRVFSENKKLTSSSISLLNLNNTKMTTNTKLVTLKNNKLTEKQMILNKKIEAVKNKNTNIENKLVVYKNRINQSNNKLEEQEKLMNMIFTIVKNRNELIGMFEENGISIDLN